MMSLKEDSDLVSGSKMQGFVTPRYDGHCISNIPDTILKLFHIRSHNPLGMPPVYDIGENSENIIFLLMDGMGFKMLEHAESRFMVPSLDGAFRDSFNGAITSVFPSTTATALTTLNTGLTPQEHGILGYTSYFRNFGSIVNMLRFAPISNEEVSLFDGGMEPWMIVPGTTIHERLRKEGISPFMYVSNSIRDNGLSSVVNRGADVVPHFSASDMFVQLRMNLERKRTGTFHFAYISTPDRIAHMRGPFTEEFAGEVNSILYSLKTELIEKLDSEVGRKTTIIVSADHGHAQVSRANVVDLAKNKELSDMLARPPTGDSRAFFMSAREGCTDAIADYFEKYLGNLFSVYRSRDLLHNGILGNGTPSAETVDRIGDLVAVAKDDAAFENSFLSAIQKSNGAWLEGRHGGLSENEMIVPLIALRLKTP